MVIAREPPDTVSTPSFTKVPFAPGESRIPDAPARLQFEPRSLSMKPFFHLITPDWLTWPWLSNVTPPSRVIERTITSVPVAT